MIWDWFLYWKTNYGLLTCMKSNKILLLGIWIFFDILLMSHQAIYTLKNKIEFISVLPVDFFIYKYDFSHVKVACWVKMYFKISHQPLAITVNTSEAFLNILTIIGRMKTWSGWKIVISDINNIVLYNIIIIITIIINKRRQCKTDRDRLTPYQSEDPSGPAPQGQPVERQKRRGKQ